MIRVADADVLFVGDLLENGAVPWFGDGYPLDWPETAFRVAELAIGVVVPGHGDHAGGAFADEQAASLFTLADLARRVHTGDMTLDDAVAATPFPAYPAEDIRRPLERALAAAPRRAGLSLALLPDPDDPAAASVARDDPVERLVEACRG